MLFTRAEVSDAVRYNPRRCEKDEFMWVYTFKPRKQRKTDRPKTAEVYLTEELKTAIDNCQWFSRKLPFAYREPAKDGETDFLAQAVYERMKDIGKRCTDTDGNPAPVEDCRPHRLRDKFATDRLTEGYALEDVSKLLYHSTRRLLIAAPCVRVSLLRFASQFGQHCHEHLRHGEEHSVPDDAAKLRELIPAQLRHHECDGERHALGTSIAVGPDGNRFFVL